MSHDQLGFIRNLLREKHSYEELPDKAVHKLTYLVYKQSRNRGVDVSIPYFWYRYGVLTPQPQSTLATSRHSLSINEKKTLNDISEAVLEEYYSSSLEDITDITYRDAPYEVFHHWRDLDKQISNLQENYNPFFDNTPIREEIEDKVERVYDSFPISDYPQHEADLSTWYFSMIRELDMGIQDVDRLHRLNTDFWSIFALSVARESCNNMTEKEVANVLDIASFQTEMSERRGKLQKWEHHGLDERIDKEGEGLNSVTDAIVSSALKSL